jgi:putative flavoprotein involved in K+ transport
MNGAHEAERVQTVVIGGGQAGLSVGYHLAKRGLPFVILEANERIGDSWRGRWDSLRLFTPARYDSLDGMPFPAPRHAFPTKDEMAEYLQEYAKRFGLPVRTGLKVDSLTRNGDRFLVRAGEQSFDAENVVVAMANFQRSRVPAFASELKPEILQMHSIDYRNPGQLREGGVLLVGAGNSGAEIALDIARTHPTWLSGRHPGHLPFRIDGFAAKLILFTLLLRVVFHRILTTKTPMGRKVRGKMLSMGGPLIRVKPEALTAAGVERVHRVTGVRDGLPVLQDGRVLDVANVIWCTGYDPDFSWIDLPIQGELEPTHERGVVNSAPGLYFVGLIFLSAASSVMIHGVGRDAEYIAKRIAARMGRARAAGVPLQTAAALEPPGD